MNHHVLIYTILLLSYTPSSVLSYLKKKFFRNAREWKLRIWDPKQKTNFARESDTSPPSRPLHARALTGDRARERCWKARGCTHTPHKTFAGTRSWKIRAFYVFSLSVYFLPRKKKEKLGKLGEKKEKKKEKEKEKERERETFVSVSKKQFFFISSSLSRARICAHLRAHIISLFFCVRARTRARKSHALLSSIDLYRW